MSQGGSCTSQAGGFESRSLPLHGGKNESRNAGEKESRCGGGGDGEDGVGYPGGDDRIRGSVAGQVGEE